MKTQFQRPIWQPDECALLVIDYQTEMMDGLVTIDKRRVELNVRYLCRLAKDYGMPTVLSTVGVGLGFNDPTVKPIRDELSHLEEIDRSTMNAWEDKAFLDAVKATGKKRLIFVALWTEICLLFPVLEALADGYEVCFVADAIGGTSQIAHDTAIQRMMQAGAVPTSIPTLGTEMFRDWDGDLIKKGRPSLDWYYAEQQKNQDLWSNFK